MSTTMDMEEQQPPAKEPRMDDPFAKEESTDQIVIQNDDATQRKKHFQEDNADNYIHNINAPTEELDKVKQENETLREKLKEAEEKAQMAKNQLEEIIQKNSHKLEEFADVITLLSKEQQKEETTSSLDHWHFASKAQYNLHEFGKITLGNLDIKRSSSWINAKNGIPIVKLRDEEEYNSHQTDWEYPLADVSIPKNITNFGSIRISYFDKFVLGFLQDFHRNSLLTNVNLCINNENYSVALSQLVPLLNSIERLILLYIDIEALIQKEYSARLLASARILFIDNKLENDWYSRWLCTPREDGKPRVLILDAIIAKRSIVAFIEHIKKDFMDSNEAVSFFIRLCINPNTDNVQSDALENSKTSERLVINDKGKDQTYRHVTIARHPMQATGEWIEEMGKEWDYEYEEDRYIDINVEI